MQIFEETASTLYYSNDGRLHTNRISDPELPGEWIYTITRYDSEDMGTIVFASRDSVKVDAYLAGYDLATETA